MAWIFYIISFVIGLFSGNRRVDIIIVAILTVIYAIGSMVGSRKNYELIFGTEMPFDVAAKSVAIGGFAMFLICVISYFIGFGIRKLMRRAS